MSWTTKRIDELGKVVTGTTPATANPSFYRGDFMFVTPTDLENESYYVRDTYSTVTDEARDSYKNKFIPKNSIIFTCIGNTIGKCGISSDDCLTNQQINSIIVDGKNNPKFLYYLLIKYRLFIRSIGLSGGAAKPIINKSTFSSIKVRVPDKPTQANIADILSAYDDLIENNRRRIQLLEQAARLLYKEWFVHLRFPGHEHTKIIDGVPEGWERKTLGDVVDVTKGKNITKDSAKDGFVPVVAGGLSPAYYHDNANAVGPVITVSTSGANAGYVNLYHEDIWASDCSYISRASTELLYYFYLLLSSKQKVIFGLQKGSAQPHVYPKDLKRLPLFDPPETLTKLFEEAVLHNFLQVKGLFGENKLLKRARDLLLPRLMNGEITI